jgi:transposase InsO family protein
VTPVSAALQQGACAVGRYRQVWADQDWGSVGLVAHSRCTSCRDCCSPCAPATAPGLACPPYTQDARCGPRQWTPAFDKGRARTKALSLERACARSEAGRVAKLEARVILLEDALAFRDARPEVLERRLGEERPRRPYPLLDRLHLLWLIEYYQVPKRRVKETFGVARSSVHRWLKASEKGKLGGRRKAAEPVNKTPREIAELIWDIFARNPMWGRHRTAMTLWALGVFISATTVRDTLLRPKPQSSTPAPAQAKEAPGTPRQIVARYPNHVWSVDRTRVWRWGVWPTWVLVAIDHFSRAAMAIAPLEGPNAGWMVEVLEQAFLSHGPPKHLISDQEGIFTGEAFTELLTDWGIKHRLGAVGKHGSIAVTERLIWTLKREWLARVPLIRGLDHLGELLMDFEVYYNQYRCHRRLGGAKPSMIYEGGSWQKPDRSAKTLRHPIRRRHFPEQRITVYELAA